jgi:hypothetical protein
VLDYPVGVPYSAYPIGYKESFTEVAVVSASNQEAPSVFAAFASAVEALMSEQPDREELRSLTPVLDGVLATAAGLLPDSGARELADGAMARLRASA